MKRQITQALVIATGLALSTIALATTTGTVKVTVPTTAVITPINSADLDFGSLTESQLQTSQTKSTPESAYTNSATASDLCLTANYGKFSTTENLPYLSPGDTDITPIYLQTVTYATCGNTHTYTGLESGQTTYTTLTAGNGGVTEADCVPASGGTPGTLTIATKALPQGAPPRVGGEYTETVTLGVGPQGC